MYLELLRNPECTLGCTHATNTLYCYSNEFFPFQIMLTHCLQHVSHMHHTTYILWGLVHFARHLQVIAAQNVPFLLLTTHQGIHNRLNTHTANYCHSNESHALQPHSPAPLVTCMHTHHTTHNPLQTINVLHRTPKGTPTGLVHTHLVTSSGVQFILVNDKFHYFRMAFLSCPVQHGELIIVCAMEQRAHVRGQVPNGTDVATPRSKVQGILSILQQRMNNK